MSRSGADDDGGEEAGDDEPHRVGERLRHARAGPGQAAEREHGANVPHRRDAPGRPHGENRAAGGIPG